MDGEMSIGHGFPYIKAVEEPSNITHKFDFEISTKLVFERFLDSVRGTKVGEIVNI